MREQPEDYNFKEVSRYKDYVIYEYDSMTNDSGIGYTYWFGNEPDMYTSGCVSIEDAKADIDRNEEYFKTLKESV